MSKAVLVLDMPNSCDKCPLCFDNYGQCDLCAATGILDKCGDMIYEEVIKNGNKSNWCPLKELPEENNTTDIQFHEGDYVESSDSKIGYISSICHCDECKKR